MVLALTGSPQNTAAMVNAAVNAELTALATGITGRNYIHNGLFNVQQRGTGAWTTNNAFTADRWQMLFVNGTMSNTTGNFNDASRVQVGDEAAITYFAAVVAGGAAAGDYAILAQNIEGVSRLSNKTVTVSFWANALSGTPKLGVGIRQVFGTGGSPSTLVDMTGQSVTLTTTSTRYSLTFSVPSTSGKTFGTTVNTDYTRLALAFSSGTTSASALGTPGVQSATFVLWGLQLEIGSAATSLEKLDPRNDLANCQRFYQTGATVIAGYGVTAAGVGQTHSFSMQMRATPTMAAVSNTNSNVSGYTLTALSGGQAVWVNGTVTATGSWTVNALWTASADL